jgi:hypothetical protein
MELLAPRSTSKFEDHPLSPVQDDLFKSRVLRRIFGPKRDEVTGGWRKLHNEELHSLSSSPDIIRMIKSIRMKWAGHVACMEETRNAYKWKA